MGALRFVLVLSLMLLYSGGAWASEALYLVTSDQSPWVSVDRTEVRALFIGKKKSLKRIPCAPLIYLGEPDYSRFIKEVVKNSPQRFERNWKKMLFSGKATLPMRKENMEEVFSALRENTSRVSFSLLKTEAEGIKFIPIR